MRYDPSKHKCRANPKSIQYREYDESSLLHCLQALTLYSILLAKGEERYGLISVVTRVTMKVSGKHYFRAEAKFVCKEIGILAQRSGFASLHSNPAFPDWQDWVRKESKIRYVGHLR